MRLRSRITRPAAWLAVVLAVLSVAACGAGRVGPASSPAPAQVQTAAIDANAGNTAAGATSTTAAGASDALLPATPAPAEAVTGAQASTQPVASPASPATATATDGGLPSAPAGTTGDTSALRLTLVSEGSQAAFRVREQLAGHSFPNDAVGTTKSIAGQLVIDQMGKILPDQSRFEVDLRTLKSDEQRRDSFIQRNTLQTGQYPTAVFVPTAVSGLPSPLPTAGDVSFQVTGDMTIHGVTKPVTWDVQGKIERAQLTGTATTAFKFGDFGMTQPRAAVVLSVEDNVKLEVAFQLTAS
jgi:polyisoprenoid-binding protein YceI